MKRAALTLALGTGLLAAVLGTAAAADQRAQDPYEMQSPFAIQVAGDRTLVTRLPAAADASAAPALLIPLPPDATTWSVNLTAGGGSVSGDARLPRLRGLPVAVVNTAGLDDGARFEVVHDGDWASARDDRLRSSAFDAALGAGGGLPADAAGKSLAPSRGTYVVITTPAYAAAAAPLLDWKRAKGLEVRLATTEETGATNVAVRDWLRAAYASWDAPPEYVLILGDVGDVPAWSISQNVTDLPYALMDEGDWLPDLMLGRMPVSSLTEAQTVVNKSVAYERDPYRTDEGWLTRQLMVAGNYGSDTPVSTVAWCGRQLMSLGFQAATHVSFPPLFNGVFPITQALQAGASMVVYRGWAYGTAGWEPPHFTVTEIPNVNNGAMTPVVMSFVCLNGDFAADAPCFGEVFLRQGTPETRKGAVAFIGNGEHWSHTRYNDAMAISFFERITDPAVTDLGSLMLAGKLRFLAFFPHELEFEATGEESVEFYFHIYNLLGDPELNFWKGPVSEPVVVHDAACPPGSGRFDVTVAEQDGTTPLAGARVGLTQSGELVGAGWTGADGVARLTLAALAEGAPLTVTVTAPNRFAVQHEVAVAQPAARLALTGLTWENPVGSGNGDGVINAAEVLHVYPVVTNTGTATATGVTLSLTVDGPAGVEHGTFALPDLAGGAVHACAGEEYFRVGLLTTADDGALLNLFLDAAHDGAVDRDGRTLVVGGPALRLESLLVGGDGVLRQGLENALTVVLRNEGSLPFPGGQARLNLLGAGIGAVGVQYADVPAIAAGATVSLPTAVTLVVDATVPTGRAAALELVVSDAAPADYQAVLPATLLVGEIDAGAPSGPDAHGYWALDSADAVDYPDLAPAYRWTHLDPALGGAGVPVVFAVDNEVKLVDLPFAFTYYGQVFDGQIRVSENGWISFDTDDELEFYNWPLPSSHGNHSMVAPFWDNFDPTLAGTGGVFTRHDAVAGTFTIEWSRLRHYQPEIDDVQTFQLVLRDPALHPAPGGDGEMLFLYRQVLNRDTLRQYATVGWESPAETDGVQLSYSDVYAPGAAPIGPGLAVLVTTRTPVHEPYVAELAAERSAGAVTLAWRPADDRPVAGWLVVRDGADGEVALTPAPLPATARGFVDASAPAADATYRLVALHAYGHRSAAATATAAATGSFAGGGLFLSPGQPNPARGGATMAFGLPRAGTATLRVFDLAGRLVRTLVAGDRPAGPGAAAWDGRDEGGRDAPAGVYFCRLESAAGSVTRKLVLVR
ncbi:MAG: T9SS type A sorting domain-containing protein [bacterium]|nr:T9SS type A sorting domain-containing protein [bacterium]